MGLAYGARQSYLKAGYYMRKSWKSFESLSTMQVTDPQIRGRINYGTGCFLLLISLVPPSLLWAAEIIGFKADRERGFKELEACRESKCIRGNILSWLVVITWSIWSNAVVGRSKILSGGEKGVWRQTSARAYGAISVWILHTTVISAEMMAYPEWLLL